MYESFKTNASIGYADRLNIEAPEQVDLHFPIAGIGSRFLAVLFDSLIQGASLFFIILGFALIVSVAEKIPGAGGTVSNAGAKWLVAGTVLFYFLLYWGYYSLFEAIWNGQTPSKRLPRFE